MKTILISGAGIAGPTLAFWLRAAGFGPTLIERAPRIRTSGYVIDFWGLGYDIAERMGLIEEINRVGYRVKETRIVDDAGRRRAGFGTRVFTELTGGRYVTLPRGELSRLLFEKIRGSVECLFGNEIAGLREEADGVWARLRHGGERRFDLVIGADGLHSAVRQLAFGPSAQFEKHLGYVVAAFEADAYRPRDDDVYLIYGQPGRMIGRFTLHDDRTLFLFVFLASDVAPPVTLAEQKALLRKIYADARWEAPQILAALERTDTIYLDRVSQIRMSGWTRGRVALIGDAAFCVSLLAGQGSALAMISAYVLAGELAAADGRYEEAFGRYETSLRDYMDAKQRAAENFAGAFAPKTRTGLFIRNQVVRAFAIPGLAKLAIGREIADRLELPRYRWLAGQ
ncbi:MAG TPA: FAD-binding domain [Bradyrhizobium sp.]|uniref:FAD-binding domain n=1 Tax=Bradyrhizobium sp. TaxID=376 RepID=UPI002B6A5146|nr:FAD-binding domain [Bradyrhizobium sp.]HLZ00654.1 FAD-binding domain [Bradyrhizobium sp.]